MNNLIDELFQAVLIDISSDFEMEAVGASVDDFPHISGDGTGFALAKVCALTWD